MMKQTNWSFSKLLAFGSFALVAFLLLAFLALSDKESSSKDTPKKEITVEQAATRNTASRNLVEVWCGEHSYENIPLLLNATTDHTGRRVGKLNAEVACSLRWHLAKFYKGEVSKGNPRKNFYVLGRSIIDSQGNTIPPFVKRFDADGNLILPPARRVDVSWCNQTLQGFNPKASWLFATHACMLLYKQIHHEALTLEFKEGLISEEKYRTEKETFFARDGRKYVDWEPRTYLFKMDFSDFQLLGIEYAEK